VRVLVVGSGGREHALVWRLARDTAVSGIVAAPGNPGISTICECRPVDMLDPDAVLGLAAETAVDLTVIGPEAPLERGVADRFRAAGRPILGPGRLGAALECSKVYAKGFMQAHGIPTARFEVVESPEAAIRSIDRGDFGYPVVIKADGLAAGKGVVIADSRDAALGAIEAAMVGRVFGVSGARLVIEECLSGPEVSVFYLCDGTQAIALSSAQDHKRIFDDDRGPNTGGMGAFAASPLMTTELASFTARRIVEPVLAGMREAGEPYVGFLYVSLMLTDDGPKVIEFNVRFGDPEAEVVLPQIEGPFAESLLAAARGNLGAPRLIVADERFVGVVLASRGYPGRPEVGQPIEGLDEAAATPGAWVFHAGTAFENGRVVTAGGRVLTVVGGGTTYSAAMQTAYAAADKIRFDGKQCRRDIGRKAVPFDR
jgi:phosphoribosylamine--glycine ligase